MWRIGTLDLLRVLADLKEGAHVIKDWVPQAELSGELGQRIMSS
jgi:hypothetical protein